MSCGSSLLNRKRMAPGAILFLGMGLGLLSLGACSHTPPVDEFFMPTTETGLLPQTMSGILKAQDQLRAHPIDKKIPYTLAYEYLQAVRENADTQFYDRIEKLLVSLEDQGIQSPEHPFLRGLIQLSKHHFTEALPIGLVVIKENPDVHRYYSLAADAEVELGNYDDAIKTLQTMADQHPDGSTLSRIAYIREIYGDLPGAREAMQQTIDQNGGPENLAWEYAELARLWLAADPAKADLLYQQALDLYPNFAPALAGKARSAMELGKTDAAIRYAEQAIDALPLPEYPALLGDIYAAQGDMAKARAQYTLVSIGYDTMEQNGTIVDFERDRFNADHDLNLSGSLVSIRAVYAERPTIFVTDTFAWLLYKNKQFSEASTYIKKALVTGSHDPMILFHAGLIAKANGKPAEAKKYFQQVQKESPHFSFFYESLLKENLK